MTTEVATQPRAFLQEVAKQYDVEIVPPGRFERPVFVPESFRGSIVHGLGDREYHTDLSAVARGDVLAALESPAHVAARRQEPYCEANTEEPLRIGRMVHMLLLEPGRFRKHHAVKPDFGPMQSSTNRKTRDQWLAGLPPGTVVMEPDDLPMLFGMAHSLSRNATALAMFEGAVFEASVYYRDPVTGLKCRVRPDMLNRALGALVDLKTARSANYRDFQGAAWNSRYDLQLAMYSEGVRCVTGELPSTQALVVLEKTPPYSCVVFPADGAMRERGARDYRRGLDVIAEAVTENQPEWRGYPEILDLTLPRYALSQ